MRLSEPERLKRAFEKRVDRTGDCWIWTGYVNPNGYGQLGTILQGKKDTILAHRLSWMLFRGPLVEGLVIDHLCRDRRCVNPEHLELVTNTENVMRGIGLGPTNRAKTHCKRGHAFTEANTGIKDGKRVCRACARLWAKEHHMPKPRTVITHCPHGHEYTPENSIYKMQEGRKVRRCRECVKKAWTAYNANRARPRAIRG